MLQRALISSWSAPLHSDNHKRPAGTCNKQQDWIRNFSQSSRSFAIKSYIKTNYNTQPINIDKHQGIYNTILKDERHIADIIKYAIQVKALSELHRFTVIVNNGITKQNKYCLLNKLQYDRKTIWPSIQDGGHFNMSDLLEMADFQHRNQYGGNFNITNISIWRKISHYGNTNSDTPLIEIDDINTVPQVLQQQGFASTVIN